MATTDIWRPPAGQHNVAVGPVLQAALDTMDTSGPHPSSSTEYYAFKYNFRPESVDTTKTGRIVNTQQRSDGQISFSLEHEGDERHTFAAVQSQAKELECVLIYDEATGEFTLEKIDCWIDLKYDRAASLNGQGQASAASRPTSPPVNDSPPTAASSKSPPTPHHSSEHLQDTVAVHNAEEEVFGIAAEHTVIPPVAPVAKQKPKPRAKAPPPAPPPISRGKATVKGKGKRTWEEVDDGELPPLSARPAKKQVSPKRTAIPPNPAPTSLPLSLPKRPPTSPPPRLPIPSAVAPAPGPQLSQLVEDESPSPAPIRSPRGVLTVDEEPETISTLPTRTPFSEGLVEEDAFDNMFDNVDEDEDGGGEDEAETQGMTASEAYEGSDGEEEGDGEGDGEEDEDEEEDGFGAELEQALAQPHPLPGKRPMTMAEAGVANYGDSDEDDSDEDSD